MKTLLLVPLLFLSSCAAWPAARAVAPVLSGLAGSGGIHVTANIASPVTNNCNCATTCK